MLTQPSTNPQERRENIRVEHKARVLFKPSWKTNQEGMIRDVSERGAFLITREKIFTKTQVILYLPLDFNGVEKLCMVSGKVVRIEEKPGVAAYGHGIRFDPPSPVALETLRKFINLKSVGKTSPGIKTS